jgi:hypothetical protein
MFGLPREVDKVSREICALRKARTFSCFNNFPEESLRNSWNSEAPYFGMLSDPGSIGNGFRIRNGPSQLFLSGWIGKPHYYCLADRCFAIKVLEQIPTVLHFGTFPSVFARNKQHKQIAGERKVATHCARPPLVFPTVSCCLSLFLLYVS